MTTSTITHDDDNRSSAEIEKDIRETRSRMDDTLDQLGNRLTPRSLINTALDWWEAPEPGNQGSAAAKKAAVTLARQARRHPMPALLIGSGIAWLVADAMDTGDDGPYQKSGSRSNRFNSGPRPIEDSSEASSSTVSDAKDALSGAMDHAKDKVAHLGDRLHERSDQWGEQAHDWVDRGKSTVGKLKHEISDGYHMGTERVGKACDDYPLAIGAACAALGALAGMLIPKTRSENEWMGEQSDRLAKDAKQKAGELMETSKAAGSRVIETVKEEAREQGLTGDSIAQSISEIAEKGSEVVHRAKDELAQAAKDEGLVPDTEKESQKPVAVGSGS